MDVLTALMIIGVATVAGDSPIKSVPELVADLKGPGAGGRDVRPLQAVHGLRLAGGVEGRPDLEMPDTDRPLKALVDQRDRGACQ